MVGVGLLLVFFMLEIGLFFGFSSEMLLIMVKCLFDVVLVLLLFWVKVVGVKVVEVSRVRFRIWMECMGVFFNVFCFGFLVVG